MHYLFRDNDFSSLLPEVKEYIQFARNTDFIAEKHLLIGIEDDGRGTQYLKEYLDNIFGVVKINGFELFTERANELVNNLAIKIVRECQMKIQSGIPMKDAPIGKPFNVTAHVFSSKAGAQSFPMHTDPCYVLICMLEGSKQYIVGECSDVVEVEAGDILLLPPNYRHMAINTEKNLMLSIGIEESLFSQWTRANTKVAEHIKVLDSMDKQVISLRKMKLEREA